MPQFSTMLARRVLLSRTYLCYALFIAMAGIQTAHSQDVLKAERNGFCKSLFPEDCNQAAKTDGTQAVLRISDSSNRRLEKRRARTIQRFEDRLLAREANRQDARKAGARVAADEQDSLALVSLYENLDGASWFDQAGWLQEPVSTWDGVALDDAGRVVELNLSTNNLFGDLPADITTLTALTFLDLGDNFIFGQIPEDIDVMPNLTVLDLSFNFFSGTIPLAIENLPGLEDLVLWGNNLGGDIPFGITSLTGLRRLSLEFNQLTGTIYPELGQLTNLEELYLDNNLLTGEIPPELGNLINLLSVFLGDNNLEGTIPTEITTIEGLLVLSVPDAGLSGPIPPEVADLRELVTLDLGMNSFNGAFPEELLDMFLLGSMYLNDNALTGAIPEQLGFFMINLVELDLAGNLFEGAMPASMGVLDGLNYLDVSFNLLTGPIPDMNANQRQRFLYLNNNQFTGTIDTQFNGIFSLFELDLSFNNLTGELPRAIANNVFMQELHLAQNAFTGSIPEAYTELENLFILNLWENDLSGTLSPSLGNMKSLFIADVGSNAFSGELPAELGAIGGLAGLFIDFNDFSGALPETFAANDTLSVLLMNDNALTFIPDMSALPLLDSLSMSNNLLTFDSIEPNTKAAGGNVTYIPQKPLPVVVDELETTIRFTTEVGGSANSYQWFLGDTPLGGGNEPVYEAAAAVLVSQEPVVLEVTSAIVTDLVLESEPVRADARLARIDLSPMNATLIPGDTLEYTFVGVDQFENERRFTGMWSASGGEISEAGVYIAGETFGTYEVAVEALNGLTGTTPVMIIDPSTVSVDEPENPGYRYRLGGNFPNPFNAATELEFEIASPSHVSLRIYDVLGRETTQVVDQTLQPGVHRFTVETDNWPAGLYLYTLQADTFTETRTMVKVK